MLKNPRRLLIIDDDVDFVTLLVDYFTLEGFDTVPAHNGPEGLAHLAREPFDLVVLDVMMPGMSGVEVLKKMREKSHIPVLMLTARGDPVDRIVGLELGADDYISKPFGVMELISRVKALLRRTTNAQEESQISYGNILVDNDKHAVYVDGKLCELTYKEFELFKYLVINKGIVLSRDKIMNQVWGFDYEGESRTVDMHIKTPRQKLGEAGSHIKTVRNVGYMVE